MVNNHGGGEFHYSTTLKVDPTMDLHTSAAHNTDAKGWVESVGFRYFGISNNEDYQKALETFLAPSINAPMFIEVFSDMEIDATNTHFIENSNKTETTKEHIKRVVKSTVIDAVGAGLAVKVKNALK